MLARAALLAASALTLGCFAAASASASSETGPVYTLKVIEGETTLPEYPVVQTSGEVSNAHGETSVDVSISRGGVVIAKAPNEHGSGTYMSQAPQVGDVLTFESPIGTVVGQVTYDGLPSMDPTVCAGSTNFSGQNSSGETVKGSYFTEALIAERYGVRREEHTKPGRAQVTALSGTSFGGSFLTPLQLGQTVTATESLETPLAGNAVFTYMSENERPVGACPLPPAPPPPPPPPALSGTVLKLKAPTILRLLKSGWHDHVTINLPGTVTQDLYLEGGSLPAFASRHRSKPRALLLARGIAHASAPGIVSVLLKATRKGRHVLDSAHDLRAVLITTLHATTGAKLTLPRRTVKLHR